MRPGDPCVYCGGPAAPETAAAVVGLLPVVSVSGAALHVREGVGFAPRCAGCLALRRAPILHPSAEGALALEVLEGTGFAYRCAIWPQWTPAAALTWLLEAAPPEATICATLLAAFDVRGETVSGLTRARIEAVLGGGRLDAARFWALMGWGELA